jgi:hypothetical protein
LLGDNFLVGLQCKLGAHGSVGPQDAGDFRASLLAKSKVELRAVNGLLLDEQAGADFDLSADAE